MKAYSLTSELDGGEWSASRSDLFTPRERAPGIQWIGGWMGLRAVLDAVVKRKIPRHPKNIDINFGRFLPLHLQSDQKNRLRIFENRVLR
jgi:hypothetical protein